MELTNYLIVGSGPAGIAAARKLAGSGLRMIDAGLSVESEFPHNTLNDALNAGDATTLLGSNWESLSTISNPKMVHPKLRSAATSHVANGESFDLYKDHGSAPLRSYGSYALGGMSNAWGGQLLRYTQKDLDEAGRWPIQASQLEPYYSDLEKHIGISGMNDDMFEFLGDSDNLLPPSPILPAAQRLLENYLSKRKALNKSGLKIGRARLSVLTEAYRGYQKYEFGDKELYSTAPDSLYSAKRTLKELITQKNIEYFPGLKLRTYKEFPDFVEIEAEIVGSDEIVTMRARHLLLACGTLHTSKLILENENLRNEKLPFMDHPPTLIPFFLPTMFGKKLPSQSYPIQLIASLEEKDRLDFISFYQPSSLLWTDMIYSIPLPLNSSLELLKNILPGMLVAQVWQSSNPSNENVMGITADGSIRIDYPENIPYQGLKTLLSNMRAIGAYSMRFLASLPEPGWGFHYAGTLPMRKNPMTLETHKDCRLWNSKRIRVIDGSVLPSLPSKNISLTIMANAARVADHVKSCDF
jgi:choline dehydrogenase-like flavoprotein